MALSDTCGYPLVGALGVRTKGDPRSGLSDGEVSGDRAGARVKKPYSTGFAYSTVRAALHCHATLRPATV